MTPRMGMRAPGLGDISLHYDVRRDYWGVKVLAGRGVEGNGGRGKFAGAPRLRDDRRMQVPFSTRTEWDLTETEPTRALRERKQAGTAVYDLTASNPTRCGLRYDAGALLPGLVRPEGL